MMMPLRMVCLPCFFGTRICLIASVHTRAVAIKMLRLPDIDFVFALICFVQIGPGDIEVFDCHVRRGG